MVLTSDFHGSYQTERGVLRFPSQFQIFSENKVIYFFSLFKTLIIICSILSLLHCVGGQWAAGHLGQRQSKKRFTFDHLPCLNQH